VIIYDLHTADLEEVEEKIKLFKATDLESSKTFIVISSAMVWGDTPSKTEEYTPEEEEEEAQEEEKKPKFRKVPYTEEDFTLRRAPPKYQSWKSIETLALSTGQNKQNLAVYVICAGVLYGNGELLLNDHFRSAWLEDPNELPYVGDGENRVPTIHVQDLARGTKFVWDSRPEKHYVIAVDGTKDSRQKQIISSISKGIGTGLVKSVPYETAVFMEWVEALTVDVLLQTSACLLPSEEEEEDAVEEDEDGEEVNKKVKLVMKWHCQAGIASNIAALNKEFVETRGLKPVKMFITGPPASGKTHYGKLLSAFYNIPHINVVQVAREIQQQSSELGEAIRERLVELKEEMIEEAERTKKKNQEIDHSKIIPRIPDDLLAEAFRWKLRSNNCRNRGFVLEGWPKNHEHAKKLFLIAPPVTEDQEVDENTPKIIDSSIFPQNVVLLKAPNDYLIQRVKSLPESVISGTHWTDEGMKRRLLAYKEANLNEKGLPSVHEFFHERGVELFEQDANAEEKYALQCMQIYIEREGKPINYLTAQHEEERRRLEESERKEAERIKREVSEDQRLDVIEAESRKERDMNTLLKWEQIRMKERELLEQRSQPLRHYLMENVVPILSDGLMELCNTLPEDPIDFLAEYLFKHSSEVRQPDPTAF
jgi:adenylate kinase